MQREMASLSVFSAAALLPQQQQQQQQQIIFSRFSSKACKLHCLPQNNSLVLSAGEPCNQAHAIEAIAIERPEAISIERARTVQQHTLLEQLALELDHTKSSDKPTEPAARAVSHLLRDVQQVSDVDAFLHDLHFSAHVYTTVIQKLGHWNKAHAAFCIFQWLQTLPSPEEHPNVYIYSSILGAMKSCGDFKHFNSVMDEMKRHGVEANLITYNTIIECYEKQGFHPEAMKVFLELTQKELIPNRSTFKALLRGSENSSDIRRALRMHTSARDILQKAGMEYAAEELRDMVSAFCTGIICAGMLVGKGPDYVISLLEMAEASMLEFSPRHYNDILWDCGSRQKDFVIAKFVMARRRKCSPPLDVRLCNHVMRFMGKEKKWWAALEVFEHMVDEGPPPDAESHAIMRSHFNFLLNASKERGTSSWSVQLLEKMETHGIFPDKYAWDTALVACAMRVDPGSAVHVFQKMIEKGQQPNVLSYGALLTTLEKGGLYEKAEQVWEHMKRLGVKPNIKAYTIMISVFGATQKYEELKKLLNEIYASDVKFTVITYNTLITMCAKACDGEGALEWMKQLTADGFKPDSTSYSQLVIALSRGGQEELARDMYFEAKQLELVLSQAAHEAVVEACKVCNVEFNLHAMPFHSESQLEEPLNIESEHEECFHIDFQPHDLSDTEGETEVSLIEVEA